MAKDTKTYEFHDGMTQVIVGDEFSNRRETIMVHERELPDLTARLTIRLIEQFGLITAEDGGEDSAGRQALKIMPADQVAQRAYDLASNVVRILREKQHFAIAPKLHQPIDAEETKA